MIRKTFYLMDIENDNGKLRWSWTGFNDWNLIEDFGDFLRIYFPPTWWGIIKCELHLYPYSPYGVGKTLQSNVSREVKMLNEFECKACKTRFLVTFKNAMPGSPVGYCVACGSNDLKYLGCSDADLRIWDTRCPCCGQSQPTEPTQTLKELVGELEKIEDELDRMPSEMSGFSRSGTLHERRLNLLSAIVKRVVAEELHELK